MRAIYAANDAAGCHAQLLAATKCFCCQRSHGVSGILHIQITLSHFCMETYTKDKPIYTNDTNDWFRMQIATTMDVDCPEWLDW